MNDFWRGKSVLVTGNTGFKGAWLSLWLHQLGARVTGLALEPDSPFFDSLGLRQLCDHNTGDIRDPSVVQSIVQKCKRAALGTHFSQ